MSGIVMRMTRAALLDTKIYEEVEADRSATPQAFAVVVLASVATLYIRVHGTAEKRRDSTRTSSPR